MMMHNVFRAYEEEEVAITPPFAANGSVATIDHPFFSRTEVIWSTSLALLNRRVLSLHSVDNTIAFVALIRISTVAWTKSSFTVCDDHFLCLASVLDMSLVVEQLNTLVRYFIFV